MMKNAEITVLQGTADDKNPVAPYTLFTRSDIEQHRGLMPTKLYKAIRENLPVERQPPVEVLELIADFLPERWLTELRSDDDGDE
jgi:hypothetical protein